MTHPSYRRSTPPNHCTHCASGAHYGAPDEWGLQERLAYWVDTDGSISDVPAWICQECLDAGDPCGPGYISADERSRRLATPA